jgi:N-dimethylarginine dimethylaminohydrolase
MAWLQTRDHDAATLDATQWPATDRPLALPAYGVDSEYGRLEAVLLAAPDHLAPVPCNSVTRESLRLGHRTRADRAARQHDALVAALEAEGVAVHIVPAAAGLPDLSFTRDTSLMTPWGLLGLRPGAGHRQGEVDAVLDYARRAGIPVLGRIDRGRIEGGDIAIVRPGLLAIGVSGERTDTAGAEAAAAIFRGAGWTVLTYDFDPHFLHLDTQFCMVGEGLAAACTDVIDDAFLATLAGSGVAFVDVAYKEARRLGCNILALGRDRVLSAGSAPRVDRALAERGYRISRVELDQFLQCGGGIHCLTMPLRRAAA